MTARVRLCLAAAGLAAVAAYPAAARSTTAVKARKAPAVKKTVPARKPPAAARKAPVPQEVLTEGIGRYTIRQGPDDPLDEVRFHFRSTDLPLPRRGAVTPVISLREYLPDLPEGAPQFEYRTYDEELARFEVIEEKRPAGVSGPERWDRIRPAAGLPHQRESQVLGLPWLVLASPRAGQTWERSETLVLPGFRERFRYRIVELTTVGGRRAWRVERSPALPPSAHVSVSELKAPAKVARWQETFWVEAGGRELLRLERRLLLVTTEEVPTELSLEVDWSRKGARPVAQAEYKARAAIFARLTTLEKKLKEAAGRTTLDGIVDLRSLRFDIEDLREEYPHGRYRLTFDKLNLAIDQGIQQIEERHAARRQQQSRRLSGPGVQQ